MTAPSPAFPDFCARLAADLDLTDPEDRAVFRGLVDRHIQYTKVERIKEWAFAGGAKHVRNSRQGAVRALADAYIRSTGAPTGQVDA